MRLFKNFKLLILLLILIIISWTSLLNSVTAYDIEAVKAYNEGIDLSKKNNFQQAMFSFKKAIGLDPTLWDAYYNLGSIYEYLGDQGKALETFEELFRKNAGDGEVAYKIASIYYKKNDYGNAFNYIRQIPPDSPKYVEAGNLYKKILISEQNNTKIVEQTGSKGSIKVVLTDFKGPTGIAKDSKDNLYVANFGNNSILQITPDGKRKIIVKDKPVNGPIGLAVDLFDNLYIANYLSNEVIKITPEGKITTILEKINKPYYLYIDNEGMLYVSEQGSNTVIKVKII
ncbi:MAG: tetratricopeptide repeat protein [bacterium]